MESSPVEARQAVQRSINRIDAVCQWTALLGFAVVALFAWFL